MSERGARARNVIDVIGVGLNSAIVGGAVAGAVYGIGIAGMAVGGMARARMARGIDEIAVGLVFFGAIGAAAGAAEGVLAGVFVGLFGGSVFAIWLTSSRTRALPPARRIARARWAALASTFLVAAVPTLWMGLARGDPATLGLLGIPSIAALVYAPYVGGRVARDIDARHAEP
jgi:hypothetical protein